MEVRNNALTHMRYVVAVRFILGNWMGSLHSFVPQGRLFERTTKHRPRIRATIRQRTRGLEEWPRQQAPPSVA